MEPNTRNTKKYIYPFDLDFEFAGYDHVKDTCYRYDLRDGKNLKMLKRKERLIFKILKTHNVKK